MPQVIFHSFSKSCPTTSWWLYNKALINQLFVPYGNIRTLVLLYGPHFIRSVPQNCVLSVLPYGPHIWLIREQYCLNCIRPGLFSRSPGPGGSPTGMPKIKVIINRLKYSFVWVIIAIKACLMQNLSLVAFQVLEIWRHKILLGTGEQALEFGYILPENGFNSKIMSFMSRTVPLDPKLTSPQCQFQQFSSREFSKFFKCLD